MLARNARVDWHPPEIGSGRFEPWLVDNVDWALSRDRYWGTPLPLWVCDSEDTHVEAIGSYAELARRTGATLPKDFDAHKPFVDAYTWRCTNANCTGNMKRVPEVIDAWFDSGSMSFAQWHYPFENTDVLARQYPADFIAEGVDQTRGWFYSLLAIAAGLGDALPNNHPSPTTAPYRALVSEYGRCARRSGAVPRRGRQRPRARQPGTEDVEAQGQRRRSMARDDRIRRGRDALVPGRVE